MCKCLGTERDHLSPWVCEKVDNLRKVKKNVYCFFFKNWDKKLWGLKEMSNKFWVKMG